jgi:subtilisin family serine protease
MFNNPNEKAYGRDANGVDDDANGYVDDWRGWDFYSMDNDPKPGTSREAAHGTSCAGIAAAKGNNAGLGVAGVAYGCRLLPVKVVDGTGTNYASVYRLGQAIRYAADYADILSCSWGAATSDAIRSAIDYASSSGRGGRGCPVFCASGNDGGQWWIERLDVNVVAGTYRFGFYLQRGPMSLTGRAAIDNVSLLEGANEYVYEDAILPREDFETDPFARGWVVAPGGDSTVDWARWQDSPYPERFHGTPSTWCARTPDDVSLPTGGWLELRSPLGSLTGSHVLRFARWMNFGPQDSFHVRLLDGQGNALQTLMSFNRSAYGGNLRAVAFPASHATAIAIGAATDKDRYADYSCYFPAGQPTVCGLFCVGPANGGVNEITTTDTSGFAGRNPGDYRRHFGGTSSATPCVAGVAGLVLSRNANLTRQQITNSLSAGCDQLGDDPYDPTTHIALHYGYGRVNANNSVCYYTSPDSYGPWVASVATKTGRILEVTFSEKMGLGVTTPANYTLSGSGRGTLAPSPSSVAWVSGNKYLLEWTGG